MKNHIACLIGLLVFASSSALPQGGGYYQGRAGGEVVLCESVKKRTQYCPMDTRGGVVLVNQISRSPCIEGDTWGVDRRGLWVTGGCRAEFQPRAFAPGPARPSRREPQGTLLVCESYDGDQTFCPIRIRGEVVLNRQLSRTECVEGYNWDYDRRGIWVDEGCRAEFLIY